MNHPPVICEFEDARPAELIHFTGGVPRQGDFVQTFDGEWEVVRVVWKFGSASLRLRPIDEETP